MATHILSLQIGSTSIPLSVGDALTLDYMPQSASLAVTGQGQEVYAIERQSVTETVRLLLYGESGAAVQSKIATIERWIEETHRRQRTRTGDRGYLHSHISSDTEVWRSEVVSARLQPADDNLRTWQANGVEMLLVITRRPYWETVVERELPLDNGSAGAKATGGVTIYNHDDADANHDNWVDIAAADVAGNLPAPLRITLTNTSGVSLGSRHFYMAVNAFSAPSTFVHILEGEAAVGATIVASAGNSGGNYGRKSWTTSVAHSTNLFVWAISPTLLTATAGGFFRVVARFAGTPPSNIEMQLHLKFSADFPITTFWSGEKMTATGNLLMDLGVVQLPPGAPSAAVNEVALVITAKYTGTSNLDIDFLQLTPAESTVDVEQVGYAILNGDAMTNNGPEDRAYFIESGLEWAVFRRTPVALYVWPNRAQRLIVLHDEATGMTISRTWSVRAYYRPRRNTL